MKTIIYYWKRLASKVPEALRRLQVLLTAISASCTAVLAMSTQFGISNDWIELIKTVAIFSAGGVAFLQFSTTNKHLQDPQ